MLVIISLGFYDRLCLLVWGFCFWVLLLSCVLGLFVTVCYSCFGWVYCLLFSSVWFDVECFLGYYGFGLILSWMLLWITLGFVWALVYLSVGIFRLLLVGLWMLVFGFLITGWFLLWFALLVLFWVCICSLLVLFCWIWFEFWGLAICLCFCLHYCLFWVFTWYCWFWLLEFVGL